MTLTLSPRQYAQWLAALVVSLALFGVGATAALSWAEESLCRPTHPACSD